MKNKIITGICIVVSLFLSGCGKIKQVDYNYVFYGVINSIENGDDTRIELVNVTNYDLSNYGFYYNHKYDGKKGLIVDEAMLDTKKIITYSSDKLKDKSLNVGDLIEVHYHNSEIVDLSKSDRSLIEKTKEDVNTITEIYKMKNAGYVYEEEEDYVYYFARWDWSGYESYVEISADKYVDMLTFNMDYNIFTSQFDMDCYYIYIIDLNTKDNCSEVLITDGNENNYIMYYFDDALYCAKITGKLYAEGDGKLYVENARYVEGYDIYTWYESPYDSSDYWIEDDEKNDVEYKEGNYKNINLNEGHNEKTLIFNYDCKEGFTLEGKK